MAIRKAKADRGCDQPQHVRIGTAPEISQARLLFVAAAAGLRHSRGPGAVPGFATVRRYTVSGFERGQARPGVAIGFSQRSSWAIRIDDHWETITYAVLWISGLIAIGLC